MLNSVFLFTWDNIYTLRLELWKWKSSFVEKYWEDGLFVFNSENWDKWLINQALYAGGLFVSKKLVIIEGIPKDMSQDSGFSQDKIEDFFSDFEVNQKYLMSDTTLIFVSYKPDKRTRIYKWLSENVQVKNFSLYREAQLKAFVKEKMSPLSISSDNIDYFVEKVWSDMFRLSSEIEKLRYVVKDWDVSKEQIDLYCFWLVEENAFVIFDQLFISPIFAVQTLENMQKEGKDRNAILWPLLWNLRVILSIIDCRNQGIMDSKQIASDTWLSPFVVAKSIKNINMYLTHQVSMRNLFRRIINIEYLIKTGKYPDAYFWLSVKRAFLELNF